MGEESELDKSSEVYKKFPFMEAFPFEEYSINLEEDELDVSLEIAPILISALGKSSTLGLVNFQYLENDSAVTVSFPQKDIVHLTKVVGKIKKLDSVLTELSAGLAAPDIESKIKYIKGSKKFLRLFMSESLEKPKFESFLGELLTLNEAVLESELILELQKLKPSKILRCALSINEEATVLAYLNFHLHYCKILLGIVIAIKIF